LVGLALSGLTRLSWTAHFRDPWTGIPQWKPVSALSARIESALERVVVTRASAVVCVTDAHADLLRRLHPGLPAEKFVTIPNGFDPAEWEGLASGTRNGGAPRGPFVLTYAGTLYERRNPLPVIHALRSLIEAGEVRREDVRVDLIGACDVAEGRHLEESVAACGMRDTVVFTGPLGRAETLRRMAGSALLLLLAEAQPLQIPGKAYEYLRACRPILAVTSEGAVAQLLRRTGGAWMVEPGDEDGIAKALLEAYRSWCGGDDGPTADAEVVRGFDRRVLAKRLAAVFDAADGHGAIRGVRRGKRGGA
jgi:glycosyltransferase involved in cell wall biosynthesis